MVSQTLEILRQGIWASLTGGWFYDPHQNVFCNSFHLYVWLFLLGLPLSLHLYFEPSLFVWGAYCSAIAVLFVIVKLVNSRLHHMFDTCECLEETVEGGSQTDKRSPLRDSKKDKGSDEGIELQVLSTPKQDSETPPVGCSSRNSFTESPGHKSEPPMEVLNSKVVVGSVPYVVNNSTIDLKVDVHRKNSESSEESSYMKPMEHVPTSLINDRGVMWHMVAQPEGNVEGFNSVKISSGQQVRRVRSALETCPAEYLSKPYQSPLGHPLSLEGITNLSTEVKSYSRGQSEDLLGSVGHMTRREGRAPNPEQDSCRSESLQFLKQDHNISADDEEEDNDGSTSPLLTKHKVSVGRNSSSVEGSSFLASGFRDRRLKRHSIEGMRAMRGPPIGGTSISSERLLDLWPFRKSTPLTYVPQMGTAMIGRGKGTGISDTKIVTPTSIPPSVPEQLLLEKAEQCVPALQDLEVPQESHDKGTSCNYDCREAENFLSSSTQDEDPESPTLDIPSATQETCSEVSSDVPSILSAQSLAGLDWLFSRTDSESELTDADTKESRVIGSGQSSAGDSGDENFHFLRDETRKVVSQGALRWNQGAIPKRRLPHQDTAEIPRSKENEDDFCEKLPREERDKDRGGSMPSFPKSTPPKQIGNTALGPRESASGPIIDSELHSTPLAKGCSEGESGGLKGLNRVGAAVWSSPIAPWHNSSGGTGGGGRRRRRRSSAPKREREREMQLTALASMIVGPGTHIASSHDDTTEGAVHCFQSNVKVNDVPTELQSTRLIPYLDEHGNWLTYTFDERGTGMAMGVVPVGGGHLLRSLFSPSSNAAESERGQSRSNNVSPTSSSWSVTSGLTVILDSPAVVYQPPTSTAPVIPHAALDITPSGRLVTGRSPLQLFAESLLVRTQQAATAAVFGNNDVDGNFANVSNSHAETDTDNETSRNKLRLYDKPKSRHYYKFWVTPFSSVRIYFDRLALLALLDRNLSIGENFLTVFLAVLVGVFGVLMLQSGFFYDLSIFIFCFVMAGCQYSLLKSVQPDAASSTHGFNRVVVFSRPVYFCLCCAIVLLLHTSLQNNTFQTAFTLYGFQFTNETLLKMARDVLLLFLLCFPVVFSLGLLPQINTFTMYLLEQVDMHVFGGTATCSLLSAFYCVFRSILAIILLYGFSYGALNERGGSQHILFSILCSLMVAGAYHISRCASDPSVLWSIIRKQLWPEEEDPQAHMAPEEFCDPLPQKLYDTVNSRLKSDALLCTCVAVLVFAVHSTTIFTTLQLGHSPVLWAIAGVLGFLIHYIVPQIRKQLPWLCFSHPLLKPYEYSQFEVRDAATIMWFEKAYVWLCFVERNIVYPILFVAAMTNDSPKIVSKFGNVFGPLVVVVCGMKCLRTAFCNPSQQYLVLIFTVLFFNIDAKDDSETFLVDYFFMTILLSKLYEFLLKVQFIVTYIAPWQITWGSAFHAFAQPFSVPHSAMLFLQAAISALLSCPLNPFLGSAIFLMSYVRPIKFWERDYNTRRVDHSNTRLATHLERNPGADDNNLNSIFYEHLTRSLQHSLCGDLTMGRWGPVLQGDCFVLASDYLNCLVHITEVGNGLVTFQMRGLEFRGTYCQQREVEAISEGMDEDGGCCCCEPGHLPHMLSVNAAFNQRWLAWEVTVTKYVLEGYSVSDNSALSMLQVFDLRKILITYYIKSIIYYTVRSSKLENWLRSDVISEALNPTLDKGFVDLDPVFNVNIDEDYDFLASGITRNSFCNVYLDWIQYCTSRREKPMDCAKDSSLVSLCFSLSLLARRTLGAASHNSLANVEFFLYGLHALFKGDFRITSVRDEWVFSDMELLKKVVAPGVRMSLKLHQDHFMSPDEYEDPATLFTAISSHDEKLVISHEGDPAWRTAVLSGKPSLLALRHVLDDGSDEYKIIMLNKRHLSFRIIKLNQECVRGLWAGQQQELVYLRNRNPERGSIQNAKQALRNIINSSCDQPIGYPIYVSPLTTSYAETNEQLCSIIGGAITLGVIKEMVLKFWKRLRTRCGESCSSGSAVPQEERRCSQEANYPMTVFRLPSGVPHMNRGPPSMEISLTPSREQQAISAASLRGGGGSGLEGGWGPLHLGSHSQGSSGSQNLPPMPPLPPMSLSTSSPLPSNSVLRGSLGKKLAGILAEEGIRAGVERVERELERVEREGERERERERGREKDAAEKAKECMARREKEMVCQRVRIVDPNQVYDAINLGRRIDVQWPDERMRAQGGRSHWRDWLPEKGMEGQVVHRWVPAHRDPSQRSHVDRTILLLRIQDKYVPIAESAVQEVTGGSEQV